LCSFKKPIYIIDCTSVDMSAGRAAIHENKQELVRLDAAQGGLPELIIHH
jgi:hypothetical protein